MRIIYTSSNWTRTLTVNNSNYFCKTLSSAYLFEMLVDPFRKRFLLYCISFVWKQTKRAHEQHWRIGTWYTTHCMVKWHSSGSAVGAFTQGFSSCQLSVRTKQTFSNNYANLQLGDKQMTRSYEANTLQYIKSGGSINLFVKYSCREFSTIFLTQCFLAVIMSRLKLN